MSLRLRLDCLTVASQELEPVAQVAGRRGDRRRGPVGLHPAGGEAGRVTRNTAVCRACDGLVRFREHTTALLRQAEVRRWCQCRELLGRPVAEVAMVCEGDTGMDTERTGQPLTDESGAERAETECVADSAGADKSSGPVTRHGGTRAEFRRVGLVGGSPGVWCSPVR